MKKGSRKSKYAGVRLSDEQSKLLSRLRKDSNLSKSELLLRGLELLTEYYSAGLNEAPLNLELIRSTTAGGSGP